MLRNPEIAVPETPNNSGAPLENTLIPENATLATSDRRLLSSRLLATIAVGVGILCAGEKAEAKEIHPPQGGPKGQIGMSDEFKETRWAYANENSVVRGWPSPQSKARGRISYTAKDGSAEVFIVRSTWEDKRGREWARIRIPDRKPREGWVPRSALGGFALSHNAIRINRGLMRLTMYKNGHKVLQTPIGVGAPGMETPAGHYAVRERVRVDKNKGFWLHGQSISNSVYGPYILMTTAYSRINDNWPGGGIIGIHGTNQPWLLPGRPSHGCVRLPNQNIRRIYPLAKTGTPIEIV